MQGHGQLGPLQVWPLPSIWQREYQLRRTRACRVTRSNTSHFRFANISVPLLWDLLYSSHLLDLHKPFPNPEVRPQFTNGSPGHGPKGSRLRRLSNGGRGSINSGKAGGGGALSQALY